MKILNAYIGQLKRQLHSDESYKYTHLYTSFAATHLALVIFFLLLGVLPLFVYNIFSVILFIYLGYTAQKTKHYFPLLITSVCEVIFHSFLCCYILGWNYGFALYLLALIPVVFYLVTTTKDFKHPNATTMGASLVIVICFVFIKLFTDRPDPLYILEVSPVFIKIVYCINCCMAFSLQLTFSLQYTLEIQRFKENLEHEKDVLDNIAKKDPLTNLLNRRAMEPHLDMAISLAETKENLFCLILCDIDDFKKVNDVYGHAVGDLVLKEVANTFLTNLRTDDVVCRWGGEEFLILIPNRLDITIQLAERLREQVAQLSFPIDKGFFSITMTFGVSEYISGYRIEKLIKIADDNLYRGKNNGKNQVVS